jgi:hypothetical protein
MNGVILLVAYIPSLDKDNFNLLTARYRDTGCFWFFAFPAQTCVMLQYFLTSRSRFMFQVSVAKTCLLATVSYFYYLKCSQLSLLILKFGKLIKYH